MSSATRIPWHTLLAKALSDALIGLPYQVSSEEELALRSQRKTGSGLEIQHQKTGSGLEIQHHRMRAEDGVTIFSRAPEDGVRS